MLQQQELSFHVSELIRSFVLQAQLYRKLHDCVQKMYGRLVLSRGDLPQVIGIFEEKKMLMDAISTERERSRESAGLWQQHKASIPVSADTARLNEVLAETETEIQAFLDIEQQLERYLQRLVEKEGGDPA
jgi:hypothetical protein